MPRAYISRAITPALLAALAVSAACSTTTKPDPAAVQRDRLSVLADMMCGSFASTQQAAEDPAYFDIRLHMSRIWTTRADGPWLYVEQARADLLDKPYRQRVYKLNALADGTFRSDVYEMPKPEKYIGAWKDIALISALTPEMLILRDGCGVDLAFQPADNTFAGSTDGHGCASSLRGAAYATSEVSITILGITSWDRGYDAAGKQVWGAEKGGYRFVKELPPVKP